MVILVVFKSFNVVKNLKKPDPVARQMPPSYTTEVDNEIPKERYISPKERQKIIDELRLI